MGRESGCGGATLFETLEESGWETTAQVGIEEGGPWLGKSEISAVCSWVLETSVVAVGYPDVFFFFLVGEGA